MDPGVTQFSMLNKTVPESMCVYNYDFDPKIENFGIRDPKMGNWNLTSLVIYPVTYGLLQVSPDLCTFQKLTSETSKSNPDR